MSLDSKAWPNASPAARMAASSALRVSIGAGGWEHAARNEAATVAAIINNSERLRAMANPPVNRVRGEEDASARDTVSSGRRCSGPTLRNGGGDLCGIRALFILRIHRGHHEIICLPR